MRENIIRHEGVVCKVNHGIAVVKLINISACSTCHAKAACNVSEIDNKELEVPLINKTVTEGEHVQILFNDSLGVKALIMGYVLPFICMLIALFTSWFISSNEIVAGLSAIAILIPYYLILTLFRKKFQKTFAFQIEKLNVSI